MLGLVISLSPPSLTSAVMRSSGGVGKTGLAVAVGERLRDRFARAPCSFRWIRSRR